MLFTGLLLAVPWTYWMAPPLFLLAMLVDITIAALYVRRFVLPGYVQQALAEYDAKRQAQPPPPGDPASAPEAPVEEPPASAA
jgi:hypothetical protein